MKYQSYSCFLFAASVLPTQACGTGPDGVTVEAMTTHDAATDADAGGAAGGGLIVAECTPGQSRACSCAGVDGGAPGPSTQQCFNGYWLTCNCTSSSSVGGDCRAGRYEGDFEGVYSSGFTLVGLPVPVVGLDALGPGLAFTLNSQLSDDPEFPTLTISDGYVRGTANGISSFEAALMGTLDCRTKMFRGTMTGGYCVGPCLSINEAKFSGPVHGSYDGATFSFTVGTWELKEEGEEALAVEFGGSGSWNAKWVGKGSVDVDGGLATGQ